MFKIWIFPRHENFINSVRRLWGFSIIFALALPLLFYGGPVPAGQPQGNIPIPTQADWTDYGPILESGNLGDWDYILWGGFAGTSIKKNDTYYLYYQGAEGYRVLPDETVTWRAIGMVSSLDGINFTKYSENPVLTWFPNNNGEEGAVSAGIAADVSGDLIMYYGANTEQNQQLINADGRLATSADGVHFADQGIVLDHDDNNLWGSGDEIFPVIALQDAGQYVVYYIPNGTPQARQLGVAWGNSRMNLNNSAPALGGGAAIEAWGMAGAAKVGPDTYALFVNDVTQTQTEVRTVSLVEPDNLSAPVETYQFDDAQQTTILLDEESSTWFMYYRNIDYYGVKLAPAGVPDSTPPLPPNSVTATPISDQHINLNWEPAADPETGIVLYRIFRNGTHIATVKGWNYSDFGLEELTEYTYEVSAVNYHGYEGAHSTPILSTTLEDETPPSITSVNSGSIANHLSIEFNEPVEEISGETIANYTIGPGISVSAAELQPDQKTVILTTSPPAPGTYNITVNHVLDRAATPNSILPNSSNRFLVTFISDLVGAWSFEAATGDLAFDTANFHNDGTLVYTNLPGPTWTTGRIGRGLYFDGVDDQVTISGTGNLENVTDSSHTYAAWVRPDSVPPGSTVNDTTYSVIVRNYTGLYYDMNRRFRAVIRLSNGSETEIFSEQMEPGLWYHLTMVVDNAAKELHLYVNGVEVDQSPQNIMGSLAEHKDAPYYIGASEPLTNFYEYRFHGQIDETRVFQRALTPVEAQDLYTWLPGELWDYYLYIPLLER